MSTKVFGIQEVLKEGWENFKKAPFLLIGLLLISLVATVVINVVFGSLPGFATSLLNALITSYFMLSTIRASVMLSKGETPDWSVLKNDINSYLRFFVATLLLSVVFIIASILFIIPLFFAMAIFFMVPYIIVDRKDISVLGAFTKSWQIATPQFLSCLIFIIAIFVLSFIGLIPLGLGLLVVVPLIYTTGSIIYKKLDAAANSIND
ncbi:MAG: hypothetical protein FWH43_05745 [Endomicrobia bacterium]|nr:hypothetical protein [Endomicrobiia bacterium]